MFDYKLKIRGIPVSWRSQILDWQTDQKFVDVQLKGPYSIWHHTHRFFAYAGGTWIEDEIYYQPPQIPLMSVLIVPFVKRDVENIFAYRQKTIEKIFEGKQKTVHV